MNNERDGTMTQEEAIQRLKDMDRYHNTNTTLTLDTFMTTAMPEWQRVEHARAVKNQSILAAHYFRDDKGEK